MVGVGGCYEFLGNDITLIPGDLGGLTYSKEFYLSR